jgi:hypothetical protein
MHALARVAEFVSSKPTLQRITITHRTPVASLLAAQPAGAPVPEGRFADTQSQAMLAIVPAPAGAASPAFRLDAGSLILTLSSINQQGTSLRAFSTLNPDLYWQRPVDAHASLHAQLQDALPPLPFPSLPLALCAGNIRATLREQLDAQALAASGGTIRTPMPLVGTTLWQGVTPDGSFIVGDNAILRVDAATGQPLAWLFDLAPSPSAADSAQSEGPLLLVQVEFLTPALTTPEALASFAPSLAGRERVERLSELVPKPVEVQPGMPVPVLALLDSDLRGWPLLEEMLQSSAQEARTGQAHPARSAVIVLFDPTSALAEAKAREAALAAEAAQRTLTLRRLHRRSLTPRVLIASACAMELEQMKAERVQQLTLAWQQRGQASSGLPPVIESPLLFSSGGRRLLDRFAAKSKVLVLVIDGDGTLIRTLPLDERAVQRESLSRELLTLIPDAMR